MTGGEARKADDRLLFFDMVRNLAMLSVVLYHAVAAYSTITPHWSVHDGTSIVADWIRELFDVFMMPVFFFVAGYFAVPSLEKQGAGKFINAKLRRLGVPWLLAILVIVPVARYGTLMKSGSDVVHLSFGQYWVEYLKGVGTFYVGPWTGDRMNQMHFWFLFLLLTLFIVLALVYAVGNRRGRPSNSPRPGGPRFPGLS
jgi:glucans biosynthesis protein C